MQMFVITLKCKEIVSDEQSIQKKGKMMKQYKKGASYFRMYAQQ